MKVASILMGLYYLLSVNVLLADVIYENKVTLEEVEKNDMLLQDLNIKNIESKSVKELLEEYPYVSNKEKLKQILIDRIRASSIMNNPEWAKLKALYKDGDTIILYQYTPYDGSEFYRLKRGDVTIFEVSQPMKK